MVVLLPSIWSADIQLSVCINGYIQCRALDWTLSVPAAVLPGGCSTERLLCQVREIPFLWPSDAMLCYHMLKHMAFALTDSMHKFGKSLVCSLKSGSTMGWMVLDSRAVTALSGKLGRESWGFLVGEDEFYQSDPQIWVRRIWLIQEIKETSSSTNAKELNTCAFFFEGKKYSEV